MNKSFRSRAELLFYFLRGSKRYFLAAVIFGMLVSLFDLLNPQIISFTVDAVLTDAKDEVPRIVAPFVERVGGLSYIREHLYLIALAVLFVAALRFICRYFFAYENARGEEGLVRRVRDILYDHIIRLPIEWHQANKTGDIIQRCTSDVETIRQFLADQLTNLMRVVILIALAIFFMARINLPLTLVAVALVPVIVGYSLIFYGKVGASFLHVDTMEGRLSAMVQENLTGIRVVRAFGREAYERERFEAFNEKYMRTWVHLMKLLSIFWSIGDLVSGLQVLLIVAVGAVFCVRGSLTAGEYIEFITYNAMLTWPVRMLGRVISDMSKAGISIDRILYIMNSPVETDGEGAYEPMLTGDIEFRNVSFTYPDGEDGSGAAAGGISGEVLRDVSFTIHAGETVGILGGTGSGKSTLVQLLDRFYDLGDDEGSITIGGEDIRKIKKQHLRSHIGLVLQEPYLFSGTLAENIAITRSEDEPDEVKSAARIAALDETVSRFNKGYDTYVGERGVTLSGGQKQRTAIAQMLVRHPDIMIFDDSLSAVDTETEELIRERLKSTARGVTTILIAHRISTLMNADRIIVLDHGRLAESGTHEELIAQGGLYARTYKLQMPA